MSFANNICRKAELSVQAYLIAAAEAADPTLTLIAAGSICAGGDEEEVTATRVVCTCQSAEIEETRNAGNWIAEVEVVTRTPYADMTAVAFHELCSEVWAHFQVAEETLLTGISNATIEFTAFKIYKRRQSVNTEAGADGLPAERVSRWLMHVVCCGSVVG